MRRVALAALVVAVSVAVAGCAGSTVSSPRDDGAAALVPSSVDLYAVADGDLAGEGWLQARELLAAFPRVAEFVDELLAEHGRELDAALGPELALAVVNLEYREAVALTQPDDPAALRRLVDEAGGVVAELEDGWWAAAPDERAIERLVSAREADGALAEREDYGRLTDDLPDDALARLFVRGGPADDALADLPKLHGELGQALECLLAGRELPSAAFALRPEDDGLRLDGALDRPDGFPDGNVGAWDIAGTAPERPLLVAAAASLPEGIERALACAAGADDAEELDLLRLVGGSTTSILSGEVAVAVYPAPRRADRPNPPTIALWAEVGDEEKARAVIDELTSLAGLVDPDVTVEEVRVDPDATAPATLVREDGEPILWVGLDRGLLVVSTTERGVEGLLTIHESPLSGDRRFGEAAERLPDGPGGTVLLYVDAEAALEQGRALGADVAGAPGLDAFDTLVLTARAKGDTVRVEGFLAFD